MSDKSKFDITSGSALPAELLQKAIEASITPIAMANLEGQCIYANAACAQLWGYNGTAEVIQRPLSAFWDPKHTMTEIIKTVSEKDKWVGELTAKRSDGTAFTVQACLSLVRDNAGKPSLIMGSFMDMTEQKRAEAAIRNAQKLESLGVLAGGIAHDFNNLLVGVLGNATLALKKLPENNEARKFLEDIILSAQTASKLTSQLLAYSGKGRFVVQPINISQQIIKIERLLRLSISKNTELVFELEEELPPVNADATQIHQVVINLVQNASEALETRQGTVRIETGVRVLQHQPSPSPAYQIESGRYVFIRVHDNGCGMTPKTLEKIFDPFFTTKFAGRGLGLSAVQGIVLAHCGTLHVESKQGKGSTIEVLFPCAEGDAAETIEAPRERPKTKIYVKKISGAEAGRITGTVLIVDDENVVRTVASHILDELGLKILTAENGRKAIDIYKRDPSKVDVILLDMTMPVMNGVETFRELKKINSDVKVILTSGYSADEVKLNFEDSDKLCGFLEKPFTAQALTEKISNVLINK